MSSKWSSSPVGKIKIFFIFNRSYFGWLHLKLWQNKKDRNLCEMPTKNDFFFSAATCKRGMKRHNFWWASQAKFVPSYFVWSNCKIKGYVTGCVRRFSHFSMWGGEGGERQVDGFFARFWTSDPFVFVEYSLFSILHFILIMYIRFFSVPIVSRLCEYSYDAPWWPRNYVYNIHILLLY